MQHCGCFEQQLIRECIGGIGSRINSKLNKTGAIVDCKKQSMCHSISLSTIKMCNILCDIDPSRKPPKKTKGNRNANYYYTKEDTFHIFQSLDTVDPLMKIYNTYGKRINLRTKQKIKINQINWIGLSLSDCIQIMQQEVPSIGRVDIVCNMSIGVPLYKSKAERFKKGGIRVHFCAVSMLCEGNQIYQEGTELVTMSKWHTNDEVYQEVAQHRLHTYAKLIHQHAGLGQHTYHGTDPDDHGIYMPLLRANTYQYKCCGCNKKMKNPPRLGGIIPKSD
eukprot:151793_1